MQTNTITLKPVQNPNALGQLIRETRKSKGLTIQELSGLANTSPRFLSELERGKTTAELGKVFKVLQTLGLDIIIQPRSSASVGRKEQS